MYQALYRKWRPRTFDDVVGQAHITDTLKRQVETGRLSHAYLFTGTRGTGKTTCAKILSRAVNCEHPVNGNPCNQCPSCLGIENGSILDVLELDAASNNGVDQVRALRDEAVYTPAAVRKRVYIVDEVHMLSTAAFNALLKILEEPPAHLMFILATTELHKVPATIKSRCQQFAFKRILPGDIAARLAYVARQEGLELRGEGAELLARLADGGLRDALSLLDQCAIPDGPIGAQEVLDALGLAGNLETARLMEQIGAGDTAAALETLARLYGAGKEVGSLPRLAQMLGVLQTTIADLSRSGNRRTDAELCLIRLCDPVLDESLAGLNARLARVEESLAGGIPTACAVPPVPQKRAQEPAPVQQKQQADAPPWEEERPPLPEEPGEPVGYEMEPAPERKSPAREAPAPAPAAAPAADLWPGLVAGLRSRFPAVYPFLSNPAAVQGVLDESTLTLWVDTEFTKSMVGTAALLSALEQMAAAQTGSPVRCVVKVGAPPKAAKGTKVPAEHDNLDDLLAMGQQFDNIIIQE